MAAPIAFVTGGSGFVGGHLVERLRLEGWRVRALVREGSNRKHLARLGCELIAGELRNVNVLARYAEDCALVYHLAGRTRALRRAGFFAANAEGTEHVVEALERARFTGTLVYLSSLACGGPSTEGRPRTEADPDEPISAYGESKRAGEQAISARIRPFRSVFLRPGPIYGPRERGILKFFLGSARRGWLAGPVALRVQLTYIDDVIEALLRAPAVATPGGVCYYTTNPEIRTVAESCSIVARAMGKSLRIVPVPRGVCGVVGVLSDAVGLLAGRTVSPLSRDKVAELYAGEWSADSAAFSQATGWRAAMDFERGIAETLRLTSD